MPAEPQTIERSSQADGSEMAMTTPTTGSLLGRLDLVAAHRSVPAARSFTRSITAAHGIPHVRDDAEICVSELVTNAIRHAGADSGGMLRLELLRAGSRLRIEVQDPSAAVPRPREVDLMEETGRGWFLVAALANRYGTDLTPAGKSVWCEVIAWPATL